jgi:hypothetical protein
VLWGFSQTIVGARLLLSHKSLLVHALLPVLATAALCLLVGLREFWTGGTWGLVKAAYLVLVAAAPVSPIFFTRSYARLAARARLLAGYEPHEPYLRGYGQALTETVVQLIVISLGMAPLTWALGFVPMLGWAWAGGVTALWALYWVSVEALDSARTLPPGIEAKDLDGEADDQPHRPWYVRIYDLHPGGPLEPLFAPARWWGKALARLTRRWRVEVATLERHRFAGLGFGAGAALVLAIPGLNLLFRPVVVTAATLMQAQLDLEPDEP